MNILVVNSGSSSLKIELLKIEETAAKNSRLAAGEFRRSTEGADFKFTRSGGASLEGRLERLDPGDALRRFAEWLNKFGNPEFRIDAVGHRIVHGGPKLSRPSLVDDSLVRELERIAPFAPLHNPPAIEAIRCARQLFGDRIHQVAVFDTAFHSAIPRYASQYALPHEVVEKHGIRRYGFHGIAHESMLRRYAALAGRPKEVNLITFQLGQGCSAAAISQGRSVETSMGFTPLEGLMMGTRSGDLDPGLLPFLTRAEKLSPEDLDHFLNERSGLLGVSGVSGDWRRVAAARAENPRCALAVEMFCHRIKKYLGAYLATLRGDVEAIVFGGGIGEHHPFPRQAALEGMEWCGIKLDAARNEAAVGTEAKISSETSRIQVWVVNVDEAGLIATQTFAALRDVSF